MSKINKWNKTRTEINKIFKLSNNQWLKIMFSYKSDYKIWFASIVVADTKRKCNDCFCKTELSPKVTYGRSTGKKIGIEAFKIALRELLEFEKTIHNTQINIVGASERLINIYRYLKRYGYIEYEYPWENRTKKIMFKLID